MIKRLVILGATGDLTARYLLPGIAALPDAGLLPAGSRIVLEKPFGENLDDAVALNELLSGFMAEEAVFRVDHFLAMTTVQNILGARLANRVLEPIRQAADRGRHPRPGPLVGHPKITAG